MAKPIEKDYGTKQTTITLPYEVWEAVRRENINVSEECSRFLADLVSHPGFKAKINEKKRIEEILRFVDPSFLKNMKKRIRSNKETASHWVQMLKKNHNIEITEDDLLAWAFETWKS